MGMKSIAFAAADIDGDVKISCTLTASSATYGSVTVDDNLDASHTPAELDANDIFVIENGDLKVTTSRGNAYILENNTLKASGAKLNGSITAETKLFASWPENVVEFSYNHNGLRTQKEVTKPDGTVETTNYVLHGKLVTHLTRGSGKLHFFYDAQSRPAMVNFNGTFYSYAHNLQGDIVGIVDNSGILVVEYRYDAWGKPVAVRTLTTAYEKLAVLNPFRYRGYVYDEETGLYYLRSRYYAPILNRFINADGLIGIKGDVLEHGIFTYCKNNSICMSDPNGQIPGGAIAYGYSKSDEYQAYLLGKKLWKWIDEVVYKAKKIAKKISREIDAWGKKISLQDAPDDLTPLVKDKWQSPRFAAKGGTLELSVDLFEDSAGNIYGRISDLSWSIPDENVASVNFYICCSAFYDVTQWYGTSVTVSSGRIEDIGIDQNWVPVPLNCSTRAATAQIFYEDGSSRFEKVGIENISDIVQSFNA